MEFLVGMGSGFNGYGVIESNSAVRQRIVASEQYPPQDVQVMAMPIRPYTLYTFYEEIADIFPLIFILVNLMPVSTILSSLVTEKETRMKEVMKMYGVSDSALTFSWFVTFTSNFVVVCFFTAACSMLELFPNSDFLLIYLFYFFFLLSIFGFCFMTSMLFDNAKTASVSGMSIWFAGFFVNSALLEASYTEKVMASVLAPIAFANGLSVISAVESVDQGVGMDTMWDEYVDFDFGSALVMLFVDFVLYMCVGLYLEQVLPKEYGIVRPWYFPFQPSFWGLGCFEKLAPAACMGRDIEMKRTYAQLRANTSDGLDGEILASKSSDSIEEISEELREKLRNGQCVNVKKLRKVFNTPDGEKVAVKSLNLTMFEGEIFVLLGHNGAGKTTTISMLSGLFQPTSGDADIYGKSISKDLAEIRTSMGVCPQHNVLYDVMTVEEHLLLFAGLRGFGSPSSPSRYVPSFLPSSSFLRCSFLDSFFVSFLPSCLPSLLHILPSHPSFLHILPSFAFFFPSFQVHAAAGEEEDRRGRAYGKEASPLGRAERRDEAQAVRRDRPDGRRQHGLSGRADERNGPVLPPLDVGHPAEQPRGAGRYSDDALHGRGRPVGRPHCHHGRRGAQVLRHDPLSQKPVRRRLHLDHGPAIRRRPLRPVRYQAHDFRVHPFVQAAQRRGRGDLFPAAHQKLPAVPRALPQARRQPPKPGPRALRDQRHDPRGGVPQNHQPRQGL
jgi:hypothetical protein